jgi:hypothetical protein
MRTLWLATTAALLPLIWGWGTHFLLARLWPAKRRAVAQQRDSSSSPATTHIDYQI